MTNVLSPDLLAKMNAYWRAANYLSVGQIYQLALDAITRVPRFADRVTAETARYWTTMERHKLYVAEHGEDMPEVRDWRWTR